MKIEVTENRIEGWCKIPGWVNEINVISFSIVHGKWHTASSMCIPSKLNEAEVVLKCYMAAWKELEKKLDNRLDS